MNGKRQGQGHPTRIYVKNFILSRNSSVKSDENHHSKESEISSQDIRKSVGNNTEINNTNINDTDLILSGNTDLDERESYRQYFISELEIECLKHDYSLQCEMIGEILELLVDTVCSKRSFIRIAGDNKPIEVVKNRFLKLDCSHIRYVIDCMEQNSTDVRNIKQYLLAALYNAPLTISSYYTAMFNNDRANGRI